MYSTRSKCADRLSPAKHNRLSIKHFVVAPYSSHDLFYTRNSQMLCLQSIPASSSFFWILCIGRAEFSSKSTLFIYRPSRVLLLLAFALCTASLCCCPWLLVCVNKIYWCIILTLFVVSFVLSSSHSPSSSAYIFPLVIQWHQIRRLQLTSERQAPASICRKTLNCN